MQLLSAILGSLTAFSAVQAKPIEMDGHIQIEERSGTKLTQAQAESRLRAGSVTWTSSGGCSSKSNPKCTSFDGIYSGTVDGAVTLKRACACTVVITGGTETGHASGTYSHGNGYKFDFQKNTKLNKYIMDSFTKIGDRGDGYPQWKSAAGNIYCDEGNHWDVTYY